MISKLFLRNFQKHKKLTIELDPKITTIVGSSDAGKSAVVRSLRWVLLNKPSGAAFIRHKSKWCRVSIVIDKKKITRKRTKSKNEYYIDGKQLKSFGSNVPKPVEDASRIGSDNIQGQHDSPYWLSLASGPLAKAINEVVDLTLIDDSLGWINQQERKTKTIVEVTEDRIADLKSQLKETHGVREQNRRLKRAEKLWSELANLREQKATIKNAVQNASECVRAVGRYKSRLEPLKRIVGQSRAVQLALAELSERHNAIKTAIDAVTAENRTISNLELRIEKLQSELSQYKECPVCHQSLSS